MNLSLFHRRCLRCPGRCLSDLLVLVLYLLWRCSSSRSAVKKDVRVRPLGVCRVESGRRIVPMASPVPRLRPVTLLPIVKLVLVFELVFELEFILGVDDDDGGDGDDV